MSEVQEALTRVDFDLPSEGLAIRAHIATLAAERDGLRDRLAAAEADARRYRAIRKNASSGVIFCAGLPGGSLNCDEPESEWDTAIDAIAKEAS